MEAIKTIPCSPALALVRSCPKTLHYTAISDPFSVQELLFDMSSEPTTLVVNEKTSADANQHEDLTDSPTDLVYDDDDEEPELHARTYLALAAMFLLNLVQVLALQGPPAVVRYGRGGKRWTRC